MSTTYVAEYAAMLTTIEDNPRVIILDCLDESSVTANSTLTSHPTVLGDNIGDHMYREPTSYGLSGTFATNGSQGLVIEGEKPSLQDMQSVFEEIKNKGILCEIVRIKVDGPDRRPTFQTRHSMALTSITWREKINSLDFNFSFTEVLQAETIEYDVDTTDENLPNVNYPNNLSFTDALVEWDKIDAAVIKMSKDLGIVTDDFLDMLKGIGTAGLVAIGIGLVVANVLIAGICASVPVVGWVVAGVVAAGIFITGIVKAIKGLIDKVKYRVDVFDKYRDDRKNQAEIKRYSNFVGSIHNNIAKLNDSIIVKQISSNEEQEVIVTIGDSFYTFTFLKNNTTGKYSLYVKLISETEIDVKSVSDITTSPTNWYDCTGRNQLFNVEGTGEYVYLLFVGEEDEKNDLTKYYIVISSINPDDFNDVITEIIKSSILY